MTGVPFTLLTNDSKVIDIFCFVTEIKMSSSRDFLKTQLNSMKSVSVLRKMKRLSFLLLNFFFFLENVRLNRRGTQV